MNIEVNYCCAGTHSKQTKYKTHSEFETQIEFKGIVQIVNNKGELKTICNFDFVGKDYECVEWYANVDLLPDIDWSKVPSVG